MHCIHGNGCGVLCGLEVEHGLELVWGLRWILDDWPRWGRMDKLTCGLTHMSAVRGEGGLILVLGKASQVGEEWLGDLFKACVEVEGEWARAGKLGIEIPYIPVRGVGRGGVDHVVVPTERQCEIRGGALVPNGEE